MDDSAKLRSADVLPQFERGARFKKRSRYGQRLVLAADNTAALDTNLRNPADPRLIRGEADGEALALC